MEVQFPMNFFKGCTLAVKGFRTIPSEITSVTNFDKANQFINPEFRSGWNL